MDTQAMKRFYGDRRFSEVWQMGYDFPGTLAQQAECQRTLKLIHGEPMHRVMQRLDQSANKHWLRSYLVIEFRPVDQFPPNQLATAGVSGVSLKEDLALSAIHDLLRHEFFHVVDKHLLTPEKKLWFMRKISSEADIAMNDWNDYKEMFADAGRDWWNSGYKKWADLPVILL